MFFVFCFVFYSYSYMYYMLYAGNVDVDDSYIAIAIAICRVVDVDDSYMYSYTSTYQHCWKIQQARSKTGRFGIRWVTVFVYLVLDQSMHCPNTIFNSNFQTIMIPRVDPTVIIAHTCFLQVL